MKNNERVMNAVARQVIMMAFMHDHAYESYDKTVDWLEENDELIADRKVYDLMRAQVEHHTRILFTDFESRVISFWPDK